MAKRTTGSTNARLKTYASKRDFHVSPEPSGRESKPAPRRRKALNFCVQKHLASHLHYDFRLEHDGVLLSWSVPKGPSLDPKVRRMAIRTEDHPLGYGDFEGVIPSGYGAGVVMLWDRGTWTPETIDGLPDAATMLEKGEIKFKLDGVKLKGSWVLVRTRKAAGSQREQWLLIKHKDDWAGDVDVVTLAPLSVKTSRDFPDILAASDTLETIAEQPPVQGGEAGKLWRDVIAAAREPRSKPATPARTATSDKSRRTKKK